MTNYNLLTIFYFCFVSECFLKNTTEVDEVPVSKRFSLILVRNY